MFEWDDARHFLAVHRRGSLSAAARELGVDQSTVGRRLVSIEERFGVKLFLRTRDGFRIAPAGERLLQHAERMEKEATAIERKMAGLEEKLTGTVRVTTSDSFGERVVAPLLAAFHARYPDIAFDLDADNRVRSLTMREADLAVRVGSAGREAAVVTRKVSDMANALYASMAYLTARGRPRLDVYSGHDFIGYSDPTTQTAEGRWIEQHVANASGARIVCRSFATAAQLRLALEGVGLALLPCYIADREPDLVRLFPPAHFPSQPIYLAVHRDLRQAAHIRTCAEFLAEGIRAQGALLRGERVR